MKKKFKKKKTTKKTSIKLKYIIYFLLLVIFSLSAFIVGYIYSQKNYEQELQKTQNSLKILQQKINKLKEEKKTVHKKETPSSVSSEIMDYKKSRTSTQKKPKETVTPTIPIKPHKQTNKKPELVIIIDDVSFKGQVRKIKAIPFAVTPSFFPPTQRHPNTPVYAREFSHYMIHLPLQAIHFNKPEPKTLNVNDSYSTILNRIKEVKKLFPNAKFLNNHTGSTFTSDKVAMVKLFKALKTENMGFVDSKTTPHSQALSAHKVYSIPLYARNIFLDNEENPEYIRNQLQKAVNIAKKRGYAIAIGHPHSVTLETLKNSADLLKEVKVVYIDQLKK